MATVDLSFSPVEEHVRTARLIAAAVGRRSAVPEVLIDEVKLAVGEACARAVALHRRAAPDELVLVRLEAGDGTFTVEVHDRGPAGEDLPPTLDGAPVPATELMVGDVSAAGAALDTPDRPGATGQPDQPAAAAGSGPTSDQDLPNAIPAGLGLAIIAGIVDGVEFAPGAGGVGTVVRMSWRLPDAAPDQGPDPESDPYLDPAWDPEKLDDPA